MDLILKLVSNITATRATPAALEVKQDKPSNHLGLKGTATLATPKKIIYYRREIKKGETNLTEF